MIDLASLANIRELFKRFIAGGHLNREQDMALWKDLEDRREDYAALFSALGFSLTLDGRGFAYFKSDQGSSYTGKQSRRLALILMLLFEYQADRGLNLLHFRQWRIDEELIAELWKQYQAILEAEEFSGGHSIRETLDVAARIGFASIDENAYLLLPAAHRYLDLFEELAQAERTGEEATETGGGREDEA